MTYMVDGTQYLAIPTGSSILPQFSAPLTPESISPAIGSKPRFDADGVQIANALTECGARRHYSFAVAL